MKSTIKTRGRTFVGTVVTDKMQKSVTVQWEWKRLIPKYERYEKRSSKVSAHNEIGAKVGDVVEIKECRPLSKTKRFIVIKILKEK
jgi:small subunit ribosomal protein S17